jgi:opacity protein-like surface antigen
VYGGELFDIDGLDVETPAGRGLGLGLGYGISPSFTLLVNYDFTLITVNYGSIEFDGGTLDVGSYDYVGGMLDLGVRYNFSGERAQVVPYVEAFLSGIAIIDEDRNGFGGTGFTLGGGVQYFASETFALRAGLIGTFGSYTTAEVDGDRADLDESISAQNVRLHLGLSFYPSR